ncbi:hypothetical protein HID58_024897 [Brassica napus]|uniref:Uncharacterized protein n=1 Tax=Brassica napus TaxID=3708 RepID=A0ABQ8CJH1_BRANA|nr:hypothetical protein HID58_024897 [Brassica napus]
MVRWSYDDPPPELLIFLEPPPELLFFTDLPLHAGGGLLHRSTAACRNFSSSPSYHRIPELLFFTEKPLELLYFLEPAPDLLLYIEPPPHRSFSSSPRPPEFLFFTQPPAELLFLSEPPPELLFLTEPPLELLLCIEPPPHHSFSSSPRPPEFLFFTQPPVELLFLTEPPPELLFLTEPPLELLLCIEPPPYRFYSTEDQQFPEGVGVMVNKEATRVGVMAAKDLGLVDLASIDRTHGLARGTRCLDRDDSEEQFSLNTDYSPPATCDLGTQQLIARLAAEEERNDLRADEANDGKKQARKRKLISLVDSEEESDVEITPPTQSTKPRRQTTYGTAKRKPLRD